MQFRIHLTGAFCLAIASVSQGQAITDFQAAARTAAEATVAVEVNGDGVDRPLAYQFHNRQLAIREFGGREPWTATQIRSYMHRPARSGFIVGSDLVISCEIPDGDEVTVVTGDGVKRSGQVLIRDEVTGLAAIRLSDASLVGLAVADESPMAGLPVLVSWLRNGKTATCESSMIATDLNSDHPEIGYSQSLDVSFSPDKLGAPVLTADGLLVGVLVNRDGTTVCLPSQHVTRLIEAAAAAEPGDLRRGRLGIRLEESEGPLVAQVSEGTPAADAGMEKGDKIVDVNRWNCSAQSDVIAAIAMARAGDEVKLRWERGDETLEGTVTLVATEGERRETRYMPSSPKMMEKMFQLRGGKLVPLGGDEDWDDVLEGLGQIGPGPRVLGNLRVERSTLEESLKKLEEEKQKQDETIKRLKEKIGEMEADARKRVQENLDMDLERLEEIYKELRERLSDPAKN